MARERDKKGAPAARQYTLQETWAPYQPPPIPQQRTSQRKRKTDEEPIALSDSEEPSRPATQRKKGKGKAQEPVVPPSDSGESDFELQAALAVVDDDDDDDDNDDRGAEEIEEADRVQLLRTLESQDTLTVDQAIVLEPLETFNQEGDGDLELSLENIHQLPESGKSSEESTTDRREFIVLHLTSLVRDGLFDELTAFVEAVMPPREPATQTTVAGRLSSVPVPKRSRRTDWTFEDPKLAEIWHRMVDRLVEEAERSDYAFDPAGLVAPSGRLDAPILFGLHWPPLTEDLPEYPTMRDMIYNPCMQWMAQKFGGLDEALTFDFRPLALRKKPGYSAHPPWHDMPSGMLEIIDETLQEIMEAATAKVAVYFGKHDYKIYRKLYPASEALKLSDVPMYSRNFTHACVEYLESGPNTGEIRRLVFFCYHPEVALRGVHQVQARLMEAMCDLAAVIVGRSGVCQGMFRLSDKPVLKPLHKQRPTPGVPAALDLRVNTKHRHTFHLACRAYGKEAKSGLLYTTESLPKRLHKFLDPDLIVHEWRRDLTLQGLESLDIDDATDTKIREALRETMESARPESSSLALQVICKLLEEPNAHFMGPVPGQEMRYYYTGQVEASRAGLKEFMRATLDTYRQFLPAARPPGRPKGSANGKGSRTYKPKSIGELEHATGTVLTTQLSGPNPAQLYDPESRLAALWLLTRLPKVSPSTGFVAFRKCIVTDDDNVPFAKEKRNLNTLWEKANNEKSGGSYLNRNVVLEHDEFFEYVIPKIQAHGLQHRIHDNFKKYLR